MFFFTSYAAPGFDFHSDKNYEDTPKRNPPTTIYKLKRQITLILEHHSDNTKTPPDPFIFKTIHIIINLSFPFLLVVFQTSKAFNRPNLQGWQ